MNGAEDITCGCVAQQNAADSPFPMKLERRRMSARLTMQRAAILVTRYVGMYFGERFPFYYVMEYPKSGGSWLADMIADYLQIPRAVQPVLPIGFRSVIHGHWGYSPRYRRVVYLYRDGRDVAVSMYFRTLEEIRHPPYRTTRSYFKKRWPSLFDMRQSDTSRLSAFMGEWATKPGGTRWVWSEHVQQWIGRPGVVTVSYEELLRDTHACMSRLIGELISDDVDAEKLAATIHKYSFEQQTGRTRGSEDRASFIRKGIAGDWRNHFDRECGRVFDQHFGDMLVNLGYESDRDWWTSLPE